MESRSFIITEESQLETWCLQLLPYLVDYRIVALTGQMGAGKTTLVRALGRHLGFSEEAGSPTFSLVNEYHCQTNPWHIRIVYHMDLYRLKGPEEALDIGVQEYLDSGEICLVEWPDRITPLLSRERHMTVHIEVLDNLQRTITLTF